ncbi:MAG: glycosyltransferase family 4 protein [Dictyoglomaceae bacterium]
MRKLRVNLIFKPGIPSARKKGGGDQTACKMLYEALKRREDVEVFFNAKPEDGPFDVIHFHSLSDFLGEYKSKYPEKIIYTAHIIPDTLNGSTSFSEIWKPIYSQYLLLLYNRAKVVIAVSPYEKIKLEEMGVKSKIVYIPNGVDLRTFKPDPEIRKIMREKFNIKDDDIVILSVGQTIKRKGFDSFAKVAKELSEYKFFWVGGIPFSILSSGYSEVKRIKTNPPPNLFLIGPQPHDEIHKFYNMADIFFFPSRQENFSIAVLEASSCGLPLLLRDLPEYREPLSPFYIPSKEEDFVKNLKILAENPQLRKEYSEKALKLAWKYDIDRVAEETVKIYKEVVEGLE